MIRPIDEPQCTRDGLCRRCFERGIDRCFSDRQSEMHWFVLDPEGERMSDVIVAGPFQDKPEPSEGHVVVKLRVGPVERALEEDRCLQESLRLGVAVRRRKR